MSQARQEFQEAGKTRGKTGQMMSEQPIARREQHQERRISNATPKTSIHDSNSHSPGSKTSTRLDLQLIYITTRLLPTFFCIIYKRPDSDLLA